MGEIIAGDHNDVIHVWSGQAPPHVLPEELRSADRGIAIIAGVVLNHARGSGGLLVVACHRGSHLRVTPCSAQQRGVWRHCQCQHNREDNCSEHVILASAMWQERCQRHTSIRFQTTGVFSAIPTRCWASLWNFPTRCRSIPARVFTQRRRTSMEKRDRTRCSILDVSAGAACHRTGSARLSGTARRRTVPCRKNLRILAADKASWSRPIGE